MAQGEVMKTMARRLRRWLSLLALTAGLVLFGVSLVAIGLEAAEDEARPLDPSALTGSDGRALLAYQTEFFGGYAERIEVSYAFPAGPGDALVVDCEGYAAMLRGEAATPLLAFTGRQQGSFVVSHQTLPSHAVQFIVVNPATGMRSFCEPVIVFTWDAADGNVTANQPAASVAYHRTPFDQGRSWLLLVLLTASSLLALLGGLGWARSRTPPAAPAAGASPLEVLRSSLDRMGEQLQRTRRHLLFAGVLGVFLWYPVLVPWAWRQAERTGVSALFPWVVSGLTLAFLLVMTSLWARELHRLDRELAAWRARMGQLREREAGLLDTLEQG